METAKNEEPLDISPDAVIKAVQTKRMRMLLGTEDIDKNQRYLMNELSETAVQCKKIESDEKVAGDDREAAVAISNVLANIQGNPFYVPGGRSDGPFIEPTVPTPNTVPGETGVEIEELNYSDFVKK